MIIHKINFGNAANDGLLIAQQTDQQIPILSEFHFSSILHYFLLTPLPHADIFIVLVLFC